MRANGKFIQHLSYNTALVSMENSYRRLMVFIPLFFLLNSKSVATYGNISDYLALIDFKYRINQDPLRVMSSWNDSIHFCNWTGVTCSKKHHQRAAFLELTNQKLSGSISPSIGNLTFLTKISLDGNSFHGEIPQEFGRLSRLQRLILRENSLEGRLSANITHCLELRVLDVYNNRFYGDIPNHLSSLNKLVYLSLDNNYFSGHIPPYISNFSSLKHLYLGHNSLKGIIPKELGQLFRLNFFSVGENLLSGEIPSSLYNISSITQFSVVENQIEGCLPYDIGATLPKLKFFLVGANRFSGSVPNSFSNASGLQYLDLGSNNFTGLVPKALGTLKSLGFLSLSRNQLGSGYGETNDLDFITHLVNCTSLRILILSYNRLSGKLPKSLANFSTHLNQLYLSGNLIHGSIPIGIENLINLTSLEFEKNFLSGSIPESIGSLKKLNLLSLYTNNFSGIIPPSFGNLTNLLYLYVHDNILDGSIPQSLGNCQKLLHLYLSANNLNGTIPKEVINLPSIIAFDVSSNVLSGSPPLDDISSSNLQIIFISDNKLSGKISSSLILYKKLEYLRMDKNLFEGTIPESLSALGGLREIDFSRNNLSGEIPFFLANFLFLEKLNLSFNDFNGEVPRKGAFANVSIVSLNGIDDICGGIPELHLPPCKNDKQLSKGKVSRNKIAFAASGASILVVLLLIFVLYWGKRTRKRSSSGKEWPSSVSFSELFKSTNGFSSDRLIGVGSFGSVYRGVMNDGIDVVAVKVLHLQQHGASSSFIAECKALKNLRHRNLIKIITVCSSVDFQGNDFKALIYEFMPNGMLEKWLHPTVDEPSQFRTVLNLIQRLNIAMDIAYALEYLHYHSGAPIAHCDLKPSNVLLDEVMTAHVGDFGLAKFLLETNNDSSKDQSLSAGLKGSIGYIPPEYGMGGQVSILGDVYSYGILLLEIFSGKSPTNDMFRDGLSLHEFSKMALTERYMEVLDPLLFLPATEDQVVVETRERNSDGPESSRNDVPNKLQECAVEVIRIGLSCSMHLSSQRLSMADVVKKLVKIRDLYSQS